MVDQLANQLGKHSGHGDIVNVGEVLDDRYELVEIIGRGGCGIVFRAVDLNLQRDVAVKVLSAEGISQDNTFDRFEQESQILRRLHSPNTVYFYDYGMTPQHVPYIVMEYVVGKQLKTILETETKLPPKRVVAILMQVLSSLNEAHSYGFVHRDLKPSNIMLCQRMGFPDDFVKVLDFGIAKIFDDDDSDPEPGENEDLIDEDIAGTPKYMAPELFKNKPFTPQSDLYSLGCIAYEMLTGIAPFDGDTLHVTVAKHLFSEPPEMGPEFDAYPNIVGAVFKLLAKKAEDRFESAQAVMDVLEHWNEPIPVPALASEFEEETETMQRPVPADLSSSTASNVQKSSKQIEAVAAPNTASRSLLITILIGVLGIVFIAAVVGIIVYWIRSTQPATEPSVDVVPTNSPAPKTSEVSQESLNDIAFVSVGSGVNATAYGMLDRGTLLHLDELMFGETNQDSDSQPSEKKPSRHADKTNKKSSSPEDSAAQTFTVQYSPADARFGILNGTGSCSNGTCTVKPVNTDKPTQIVFSSKGYVPKSIVLKGKETTYTVMLQKTPGSE